MGTGASCPRKPGWLQGHLVEPNETTASATTPNAPAGTSNPGAPDTLQNGKLHQMKNTPKLVLHRSKKRTWISKIALDSNEAHPAHGRGDLDLGRAPLHGAERSAPTASAPRFCPTVRCGPPSLRFSFYLYQSVCSSMRQKHVNKCFFRPPALGNR